VISPSFVSSQLVVTCAVTVSDTHLGFHENPKVIPSSKGMKSCSSTLSHPPDQTMALRSS
jgi:hypothetical protein